MLRSVRKGTRSVSSVSWGSLNHDDTGTALLGWKIYEAGELSRIMVSAMGRPSCDRSCHQDEMMSRIERAPIAYLNVVAPVVITAFSEQPMRDYLMDI
jgi:hypothetical protein